MNVASGRKVVVTGGGSGIGLEVARRLASQGAAVALLGRDLKKLDAAAAAMGGRAIGIRADVSAANDVRAAVERASAAFGGLDTVIASAAVVHFKPLGDVTEEDWNSTLDINLKGAFFVCQAAAPLLIASGRGRIVTISSAAGRRGYAGIQAYCASKFGLVGLTESLACELAPHVTVNCVCPGGGPIGSPMGQQTLEWKIERTGKTAAEIRSDVARGIPLGRPPTEGDVAETVLFFVSDSASILTGVTVDVDGGLRFGGLPGTGSADPKGKV
jgi:meso-butanediol dehydrogenase / (S,S)-butanediol dehydrogenase / diacetyl reductase